MIKSTSQTNFLSQESNEKEFFDQISKDIKQSLILFLSERGHGKSSSLKNIVKQCKDSNIDITIKTFDPSQTWYKIAPLAYRQFVTREKIQTGQVANIGDCVYEIGALTEEERRAFVGMIISQDYKRNYMLSLEKPEEFKKTNWIIYILEEANVVFGSFSFRRNDWITPILQDFVSVGRNFKLGAFLVATAEEGEISPSLRRRSRRIYGRLVAEGDIARVRKTDKAMANYLAKEIPRFNFVYWGGAFYGPVHIKDVVTTVPADYVVNVAEVKKGPSWMGRFLFWFCIWMFFIYMFLSYFHIV